jgi:thioredoxin-related protein
MKKLALATTIAVFAIALTSANAAAPAGWTEDYAKAVEKAKTDKKLVLLDFTGSDWCGWCIKLDKEVFSKSDFKNYAKENLVLVELDFPNAKPQTKKVKDQNKELAKKFGVQGYPTIVVLDADGKEVARWGGYSQTFLADLKTKVDAAKPK